jgi:sugar lactone lactonase YvrE
MNKIFTSGPVGFVEGVWNPEDLVSLPDSPWIIVSAMRSQKRRGGLLAAHRHRSASALEIPWSDCAEQGRLGRDLFDPHGISARRLGEDVYELLVIDHGGGEAVDRLRVDIGSDCPVIAECERIVQPPHTSGNAVAHMADGGFVLTSMFDPDDADRLSKFAEGRPTGGVWRWTRDHGWGRFGSLELSGANGIAAASDGSAVYVSEWSARRIWRLNPDGEAIDHALTRFLPDNLRWTSNGKLLVAGQLTRPELLFGCEARGEPCPLAFEVAVLDPDTLKLESRVSADEEQAKAWGFGGATGALEVDAELWVGSFTGERIGKFRI